MRPFSAWLKGDAAVQENLEMQTGSATGKSNFAPKAEKDRSFTSEPQERSNQKARECPIKNGEHKLLNCNQIEKMGA